ncbi:MAG: SDR family NAD(P)-dependent oxidoreductase [Arcobacter sp.]|uniref:SDR family NAD(P)-dependent oxidoreductase n=1 Tax=Arcobacter sp. TaxID=1872629 RepID=UPI0025896C01|nr:SDR family NAD(P)-dependent oxidoreductase [Arcobacter sp.]MDD3007924.1 SDR family NAD(P)-dependent oxidoreductase [Arcobacter sp.]MDY3204637.1 SDR family NAD(P)-dependent oxidoreductase [Arcobacter sp.]
MQKNILITGCSSGLGLALTNYYLEKGFKVFGISRTKPNIENLNFIHINFDLSQVDKIKEKLTNILKDINEFETVFLNAGMLGKIKVLKDLSIEELNEVYTLNVYANKELLDILMNIKVKNIIIISSGASKNGYKGWGSYSLSKAGVNMLANLYSNEMLNTKILAVAPGVIKTPMTDYIRFELDVNIFPSVKKLNDGVVQTPQETAIKLDNLLNKIDEFESGSYVDVRLI